MAPGIVRRQVTSSRWRPSPAGRWRFLADASTVLDASLDYEQTLASTARLAVPEVADYCIVVLVDEDRAIRWPHSAHRDPGKDRLLDTWREHLALACTSENPVARSLRTGKAQLVPVVGQQVSSWWNLPHVDVLDALLPMSCVAVPLIARGLTFGALLFAVTCESGRRYGPRDVELALDVAGRAASAIDHALLYRAAERAARDRDELMAVVAHDLKNPLTRSICRCAGFSRTSSPMTWRIGWSGRAWARSCARRSACIASFATSSSCRG
jgi:GAF domain-containing protein